MSHLGSKGRGHQGRVPAGERTDEDEHPASVWLLGHCSSFPLHSRTRSGLSVVVAGNVSSRHAVFLLHLARHSPYSPYFSRRHEMQSQVRKILGRVLSPSTLQDYSVLILGERYDGRDVATRSRINQKDFRKYFLQKVQSCVSIVVVDLFSNAMTDELCSCCSVVLEAIAGQREDIH